MKTTDQPSGSRQRELFLKALEKPTPAERRAFLDGACGDDCALRASVEALLANHQEDSFLEESPAAGTLTVAGLTSPAGLPPAESPGDRIGRYKLLQVIGEGGMGVVYMAEQEEPVHRRVALKIIKLGMDTKSVITRFEAERQALALMDHPNIAKVLDGGATEAGRPYFVMELVRGIKITQYCDEAKLSTRDRLDLFIQVCQAIQHAHQKGIIHRDIKPSNILVTINDGVAVPKVIDFGIAKATEGRLTDKTLFTQFEALMGTPAYMSPEQAVMTSLDIDTRSDIYSLGVLLYELLAGSTPFDAKELMASGIDAMRKTIREKEPLRPSTKLSQTLGAAKGVGRVTPCAPSSAESTFTGGAHGVTRPTSDSEEEVRASSRRLLEVKETIALLRGDLDWIVMKCLEKDRARRYETANGLASDIQRHLNNEAVLARPPSAAYRFQKLVRRNTLAFAAGTAIAVALVLGVIGTTIGLLRAEKQRLSAEEARQNEALLRQQAQARELVARRVAYNSDMNLAQQALQLNNIGRALEILNRHRPKSGESELRGWEWRYLWKFCQSDALFTLCRQSNGIYSVSFSPDGRFLAVEDGSSEVAVWDLVSRKRVMSRRTQVNRQRIAFSPVGNQLAFCEKGLDGRRTVKLWDAEKGQDVMQWLIPGDARELVFAKDGSSLAAWSAASPWNAPQDDSRIFLWDIASGRKLFETAAKRAFTGMGNMLALSDQSRILAHGSVSGEVVVIDVAAGRGERRLKVTEETTMAVAILNEGKVLASASGFTDPAVKFWDLDSGKEEAKLEGHRGYVNALASSPDGRLLASASSDQTIRIWDWKERRSLMTLRGHLSEVLDVAFAPDGQTLASGCKDGTVFMWNIASNRNERPYDFRPVIMRVRDWSFAPDNRIIVGLDDSGAVRSWTTADLQENRRFEALGTNNTSFALSKSGTLLAVGTQTGGVHVINLLTDVEAGKFTAGSGRVMVLGFAAEENLLLTHDQDRVVSLWDIGSGQRKHQWQIPEPFEHIQLARAADVLLTKHEGQLTLWRTKDGQRLWTAKVQGEAYVPGFSHNGKMVAIPSGEGATRLFDTRTGAESATLRGFLLGAHSVAFSPDDQRFAIGSNGKEAVKVWDTELRQEVLTLEGEGSIFFRTAFSPDGRVLGSTSRKGLHFWRAPSWEEIAVAEANEKTKIKQP